MQFSMIHCIVILPYSNSPLGLPRDRRRCTASVSVHKRIRFAHILTAHKFPAKWIFSEPQRIDKDTMQRHVNTEQFSCGVGHDHCAPCSDRVSPPRKSHHERLARKNRFDGEKRHEKNCCEYEWKWNNSISSKFHTGCIAIAIHCVFALPPPCSASIVKKNFCSICGERLLHKMNKSRNQMQSERKKREQKCTLRGMLTIARRQYGIHNPHCTAPCETHTF